MSITKKELLRKTDILKQITEVLHTENSILRDHVKNMEFKLDQLEKFLGVEFVNEQKIEKTIGYRTISKKKK